MNPQLSNELLAQAILALANQQQAARSAHPVYKAVASTPTASYGHGTAPLGGTSGIFSYPGLEPDIVNAMVMPRLGLADMLPSRTTNTDNPLYGIMTGVTDSSGSEPSTVCADYPTAGLMKLCTHAFQWGRFGRDTTVLDMRRIGRRRDRSDFLDFNFLGNPLAGSAADNFFIPQVPGGQGLTASLRNEIAKNMFEFAITWGRDFARLLWTGNPSNNLGEGYKEPHGLDILINTGYQDAETGDNCPAADSIVRNFNSVEINTNAETLIAEVTNIYTRLKFNASRMGLDPVKWAICMPWALFYEVAEVWACAYSTYRCKTGMFSTSQVEYIDAADTIALRDRMRQGKFLLINGEEVPVIEDDSITETPLAGSSFRSTIYFVPLRYLGNRPALFFEYFDYSGPGAAIEGGKTFAPNSYYTTNNGRFLWHAKPPTQFCVQLTATTDWRIVLETPQIAARLTNVKYTPRVHQRDWHPDDSFYADGGRTSRSDNSYYTPN